MLLSSPHQRWARRGHQSPRPLHRRLLAPTYPTRPRHPRSAAQTATLSRTEKPEAAAGTQSRPFPLAGSPGPARPRRGLPGAIPAAVVPGPPRVLRAGSGAVTPGDARHGGAAVLRLQLPRPGSPFPFPAPEPEAAGRETPVPLLPWSPTAAASPLPLPRAAAARRWQPEVTRTRGGAQ